MNLPDKCPFCGAAIAIGEDGKKRVADLIVIFDCGSGFDELIDPIRTRSRVCKDITRLAARVAELEAENKTLRDRFSDADTERNAAQAALKAAFARVAELEARCRRLDELGSKLEEEKEAHAWEISPAMAQAKIDELNARVAELEARCRRLEEAGDAMASRVPDDHWEARDQAKWRQAKEAKP